MKNKKFPEHVIFKNDMFNFDIGNTISFQECTGLIPIAPKTEEEFDSYEDLFNFSPDDINIFNI